MSSADEKATAPAAVLPQYGGGDVETGRYGQDGPQREANFLTRNGLNLESFKKRESDEGVADLDKSMKKRHLHMIAIGGSIGAGFFVGSRGAFGDGGPGWVLIDFLIIGIMMFQVVYAIGELAIMYPVNGSFYTYSTRFIDPSWGFAMGWNYVFQWAIVLPLELTVCGEVVRYWPGARAVPVTGWIAVFWVFIIIINVFGTLGYAEEEFWASLFKLSAVVIFMIVAVVLVCGGGPAGSEYDTYQGTKTWYIEGGAFRNGFQGFCSVFSTAAFSFAGTELVGLAAAEAKDPFKNLPGAIKQVFWRITLFYILGLFLVGLLVPADHWEKMAAEAEAAGVDFNAYEDGASPFVIAAKNAHLWGYDSFMNVVILVSVVSIGTSCVYGGSRTLLAMAEQGYAPKIFTFVDKSGRPMAAVGVHLIMGALAYIQLTSDGQTVFEWLLQASALSSLFTWGSVCLAHIRFRSAWAKQGHTLDELPFQALFGVAGSWLGFALCIIVLIATLINACWPLSGDPVTAYSFFNAWLTIPIVLFFWICGYFWKREGWRTVDQIDLDTGRRSHDWDVINAYRAEVAAMPKWKRIVHATF